MLTEFRQARVPDEIRSLTAFDRKVFPAADCFPARHWRDLQSYWLIVGGVKVGCSAFELHADFERDGSVTRMPGSLYIASTGILPRFQGHGFGTLLKSWQVAYAGRCGFQRIVTNMRKQNKVMIHLNRKFRFRVVYTVPRYYLDPPDSTVVMELLL